MDGKEILYRLNNLINEEDTSGFIDKKTSYDYLNEGAIEFVERTNSLTNEQSVTTVADQADYSLNANFTKLYLKDKNNRYYIKYNNGSVNTFIYHRNYGDIVYEDNTTSSAIPSYFTILDDTTLDSQVSGTVTSTGAESGGESTLTDSGASFSDISAGDIVHNTTDDSDGIVTSKTSSTALKTALFNGTNNDWTSGDSYVIQPQGRLKIKFTPPPGTAGHTATVYYVERPAPLYADYLTWRFQPKALSLIIKYAAALYNLRDEEFSEGGAFLTEWDREVRQTAYQLNQTFRRTQMGFNLKGRRV